MKRLKESIRIKQIEKKWDDSIESILYKWHWKENLMHKEIARRFNIPRPTISRWFRQLKVPSQDPHRITNLNLLKFALKRKKIAKTKIKCKRKIFVNKEFFKKWSSKMAYVLGYFAADGCMFINPRGSHFFDFTSIDKELIKKVKAMMASKHTIGEYTSSNPNRRTSYRLQIGSKEMFKDILKFGFTPRKSKSIKLPNIPSKYFSNFLRGYFDGDGCVDCGFYNKKDHKSPQFILMTRFTCGSRVFLEDLFKRIQKYTKIQGGCIVDRKKSGYDLQFSIKDSLKLYEFMYIGVDRRQFLERKYNIFQKAIKHYGGVA